jgi:hypothetical protein
VTRLAKTPHPPKSQIAVNDAGAHNAANSE